MALILLYLYFLSSIFFLFFGWGGGGYIFGRRINWGVSFGYGDFFWGGGYIFNKFELVKKSPFSFLPP